MRALECGSALFADEEVRRPGSNTKLQHCPARGVSTAEGQCMRVQVQKWPALNVAPGRVNHSFQCLLVNPYALPPLLSGAFSFPFARPALHSYERPYWGRPYWGRSYRGAAEQKQSG